MTRQPTFRPRPRINNLPTYEELSREQDSVMRLPAKGRYLIKGAPGTGKTVMTLLRAASLKKRNKDILYLLYYNVLSEYCRQLSHEPIKITSYHSWICKHFNKTYGQRIPKIQEYVYDWVKAMDICWEKNPEGKKDAETYVIIDEGQDMPKGFYEYLDFHFENIFVSADENQQIGEDFNRVTFDIIQKELGLVDNQVIELTHNYRNTREIAAFCNTLHTGAGGIPTELPKRSAIKPLVVKHQTDKKDKLAEVICTRLHENPHQLVGLVPFKKDSVAEWEKRIRAHGMDPWVYRDKNQLKHIKFSEGGIIITNFHNIKGLEFDRLYVPDLRDYQYSSEDITKMNLYVLCSRPKDFLVLLETIDCGADKIFSTVNQEPSLFNVKHY